MKNNKYTFKLIDLDVPVSNYFNKVFPTALIKQFIESAIIQEKLNSKSFFCVLVSYPQMFTYGPELDLCDVCAEVEKIYIEDSQLKIDIEVLDTEKGRILQEILSTTPNLIKCNPVFIGKYSSSNPEIITECELQYIYFID